MKIGTSERPGIRAGGKPDSQDFCASCGLPTGGMTVDGLCMGCHDWSRPNIPRTDLRCQVDGPFR